jgi:Leucine Rich repeat
MESQGKEESRGRGAIAEEVHAELFGDKQPSTTADYNHDNASLLQRSRGISIMAPIRPDPESEDAVPHARTGKPISRRKKTEGAVGVWLLAAGGGCLMLAVVLIGGAVMLYFALCPGGPPPQESPRAGPAGDDPAFQKMANRLTGRWVGELPQGGSVIYDYRADGTFTLSVQHPDRPLTITGIWQVSGIGAESLGIKRQAPAAPSDFFAPDQTAEIFFPAPNLMRHAIVNGAVDCAREGSGAKPGQLPPLNERQQAIAAIERLGAHVQRDAGFDGRVHGIRFTVKQATDADLALLRPLTDARLVDLSGNRQVTDAGLLHIAVLTNLEALDLDGTQVTDGGLARLQGLKQLVGLHCGTPTVGDEGLASLQALPKLQSLHLKSSGVTDAGLAHIGKLTRLSFLDLDDTMVTDAGLAHLHGLSKLAQVRLRRTKVSDAGVQALTQVVPAVLVVR